MKKNSRVSKVTILFSLFVLFWCLDSHIHSLCILGTSTDSTVESHVGSVPAVAVSADGVRHRRTAAHSQSEISPLNSKKIFLWVKALLHLFQ